MKNKVIKTGLIQHSYSNDIELNRARNLTSIENLSAEGADLVILSELHDSIYFCQSEDVDNFKFSTLLDDFSDVYAKAASDNNVVLVTSAFEKRAPGIYHNTSLVFEKDGSLSGMYRKMHIPDDPGFYEKFYFTPGDIGFRPIKTSVGVLGVLVCWDQWYPEAARIMAMKGADILIYPTAIGWNPDDDQEEKDRQREAWITIQRSHAIANGLPVVSVNRCGFEDDLTGVSSGIDFWGSSFACGPQGEILKMASVELQQDLLVEIDLQRSQEVRHWWPFFRDRRIECYDELTSRFLL